MQFFIFFVGAFAMASAGLIVKEHHVVDTPMERTSIIGPSGSIVQEKKIPFVETKLREIEPAVKVIEKAAVIAEPVPEIKSIVPVVKEVPLAKIETVAPLTHHVLSPLDLPIYKSMAHIVPDYKIAPGYPVVPAWYSHPWFRSDYPYYNECPNCFL